MISIASARSLPVDAQENWNVRWHLVWVMALVVVLAEGLLSQAHGAA